MVLIVFHKLYKLRQNLFLVKFLAIFFIFLKDLVILELDHLGQGTALDVVVHQLGKKVVLRGRILVVEGPGNLVRKVLRCETERDG